MDPEAIEAERFQADCEQAELEAAGREYARGHKRMLRLRAEGKLREAAAACLHGAGYPLASLAAERSGDPGAGGLGFRCSECGSVLSEWAGAVLKPCDWVRP
jgi:hypothetical protein